MELNRETLSRGGAGKRNPTGVRGEEEGWVSWDINLVCSVQQALEEWRCWVDGGASLGATDERDGIVKRHCVAEVEGAGCCQGSCSFHRMMSNGDA